MGTTVGVTRNANARTAGGKLRVVLARLGGSTSAQLAAKDNATSLSLEASLAQMYLGLELNLQFRSARRKSFATLAVPKISSHICSVRTKTADARQKVDL